MSVTIVRNDTFDDSVAFWTYKDDAGVVIDITGYSVKLVVRTHKEQPIFTKLSTDPAGNRVYIPVGTDGQIHPDITAANMAAGLQPIGDDHEYDLEITSPGGTVTTIVNKDVFKIKEDLG